MAAPSKSSKPKGALPLSSKSLGSFYRTPDGKYLNNEIENCLTSSWDEKGLKYCHLLCVGFPPPGIMETCLKGSSFTLFSPAFLGPQKMVQKGKNMSVVGDEAHLPFPTGSYDRILVFHTLEYTDDPASLFEGLWRILSPGGRLYLMVPNKKGAWKKSSLPGSDQAKAFLFRQIRNLLDENGFKLIHNFGARYGLPVDFFGTVLFSGLLKRLSGGGSVGFPGFLIFDVEKIVILPICKPARKFRKVPAKGVVQGAIPE